MTTTTISRAGIAAFAACGVALYFANVYGNTPQENGNAAFFFVSLAVCGAVGLWLFRQVIPRAIADGSPRGARRALIISAVALVAALPAFWSGLAYMLGAAGAALGAAERRRGAGGLAVAAVCVGVLALAANSAIIVLDEVG